MHISHKFTNEVSGTIAISIEQSDIQPLVENELKNIRKTIQIPGFRKGFAPMNLVKNKYEKAVRIDEIDKLVRKSLNEHIQNENLQLFTTPQPVKNGEVDFFADSFTLEFSFGIRPKFEVDLASIPATKYVVMPSEKSVEDALKNIQKTYAKRNPAEKISDGVVLSFDVEDADGNVYPFREISFDELKNPNIWLNMSVGESVTLLPTDILNDINETATLMKTTSESLEEKTTEVKCTIKEIFTEQLPELDDEFFKNVYKNPEVTSKVELIEKIREEQKAYYAPWGVTHFFNQVVDHLLKNTQFPLPKEVLIESYRESKDGSLLSYEEAEKIYENAEKAIRYQLIEEQILQQHHVQIDYAELANYTKEHLKNQLKSYGLPDFSEEEMDGFVQRTLSNEQQAKEYYGKLVQEKLTQLFLQYCSVEEKEISVDDFLEMLKAISKS